MKRKDPKTGRFLAAVTGVKTPKMLLVEERLGTTLEKDFQEYYVGQSYGQKRLAARWGVNRKTIFGTKERPSGWVQKLGLDYKQYRTHSEQVKTGKCENIACSNDMVPRERSHWIPSVSLKHNIILLCPNCHSVLDKTHNPEHIENIRVSIFSKTMLQIGGRKNATIEEKLELLRIARQIIERREIG